MRRLILASVTAAMAVSLVGCGAEPAPTPKALDPPTTSTPSPTPSPSPTPTPPVVPKAAGTKDKAGAIAFAKVFIETVNYSQATGDTKPLRALYIAHCTKCEAFADAIDTTYESGGFIHGGSWTHATFRFYDITNDVAFVDSHVDFEHQTWLHRKGGDTDVFTATMHNLEPFNLRWGPGGWSVSAIDPTS